MLVWGIVASGLAALFFWKKANPTKNLSDTVDERIASADRPRTSVKP